MELTAKTFSRKGNLVWGGRSVGGEKKKAKNVHNWFQGCRGALTPRFCPLSHPYSTPHLQLTVKEGKTCMQVPYQPLSTPVFCVHWIDHCDTLWFPAVPFVVLWLKRQSFLVSLPFYTLPVTGSASKLSQGKLKRKDNRISSHILWTTILLLKEKESPV